MAQVKKDEVRARIAEAALREFAGRGYTRATMAGIARRAGLGAGSTYRYHAGKRELFDSLVTPALVRRFEGLLSRRVRGLARGVLARHPRPADDLGDELLRFWVEHRLAVVILLDRAEGTPHRDFGRRFVERLAGAALASLRAGGARKADPVERFVLLAIFDNTRRILAAILEAHPDEAALRRAVTAFWSYQIPGLRGIGAWMRRAPAQRKRSSSRRSPA